LNALVGYLDGPPKSYIGLWSDTVASFTSAFAILSCLHYQSKTGIGQWIDLAIQETTAVQHGEPIMDYVMNQRSGQRTANRSNYAAPHNVYPCQGYDKWVAIDVSTDEDWMSFCRAIGKPEWSNRQDFSEGLSRWQNQEELDELVGNWTRDRTAEEVMEIMQANGVPSGVCLDTENLANDKQLLARNFFPEIEHPDLGKTTVIGLPWKMSDSGEDRHHAPLLGQDNDYVFHELLGLPRNKISELIEEKIIY
jgi:crotonobetainyl-CoA:carnitine CoA-transferase CaiB-like acyl-CoA transferase